MKLAIGLLPLLSSTAFASRQRNNPTVVRDDGEENENEIKVAIEVDCKGVQAEKLSLKSEGLAAHVLQDSYNKVHQAMDAGDSYLTHVHFDHLEKKKHKKGQNVMADALYEVTGWGDWYANWYEGGWGCELCPEDDFWFTNLGGSGAALRAWEKELASGLLESGNKDFANVGTCSIKIMAKPAKLAVDTPVVKDDTEDKENENELRVAIEADCKGVKAEKLSLKAEQLSAILLQNSYNKVHEKLDSGDSYLAHVHFDHLEKKKHKSLGGDSSGVRGWGDWYANWYEGGWGCELCPEDDFWFTNLGGSGAALRAWEDEYTTALVESGHSQLNKAKACAIKIMAAKPRSHHGDEAAASGVTSAIRRA